MLVSNLVKELERTRDYYKQQLDKIDALLDVENVPKSYKPRDYWTEVPYNTRKRVELLIERLHELEQE